MIKTLLCLQIFIELYGHFAWKSKTNETEGWKFHTGSCKGLTIWFLRRGGGVPTILVTSEKNILHTDFEGKNSCKEIPSEKNPTLKKISFMPYDAGKNLTLLYVRKKMFHQRFEEKYSYPKPNQERKYCISGHHHHLLAFVLQQILKDTAGC